jgi:hypothetical protein
LSSIIVSVIIPKHFHLNLHLQNYWLVEAKLGRNVSLQSLCYFVPIGNPRWPSSQKQKTKKKRMSLVCLYVGEFTFSTNLDDFFSSFG